MTTKDVHVVEVQTVIDVKNVLYKKIKKVKNVKERGQNKKTFKNVE